MNSENRKKILAGHLTAISTILAVFLIRALFIASEFKIAEKYGYAKHVSYSSELKMFFWNIIPFLIMWVDLFWQHWLAYRYSKKSIDTRPLIIVSIIGFIFYFSIDTSRSDGLGIAAGRILTPILLIFGFLIFRFGFPKKGDYPS